MKFDARSSRRLRLRRPAAAMTSLGPAQIVDVGPASLALFSEWSAEKGAAMWIEFVWSGSLIRLNCEVRACRYSRADGRYRSGVTVRGGLSAAEFRSRVDEAMRRRREKGE